MIYWKNGKIYKVDRVIDVYKCGPFGPHKKVNRYGIEINGHFTDLIEDDDKWYVYEKIFK